MTSIYVFAAGNERGGAASHLVTLAQVIAEHGTTYQYHFVMAGMGPLADKLRSVPNTNVVVLDGGFRAIVRQLTEFLDSAPENSMLHAHGPRLNILSWLATRKNRVAWTSTLHSHLDKDYLSSRFKSILFPRLNRMSLRRTVGIFVVNPFFATLVPGKPFVFVPNGLNLEPLSEPSEYYRKVLRDRLGLEEDAQVIGIAARLDPVKDIGTMIRACAEPALKQVHLAIAGDGDQRRYLEELATQLRVRHRVHFLGFIDGVREFYSGLDVHVLASISEGTPFSILEAGFFGVPNVGSDIPGITQLVHHQVTGLCFPVGDSSAMAAETARILNDEALKNSVVSEFKSTILPKYTPLEMLKAYENGYEKFVPKKSTAD